MTKKNDNYTIPGDTSGGIVGRVTNPFSHRTYFVSTVYQEADECWTTIVYSQCLKESWCGLLKRMEPLSVSLPLTVFRNTEPEAHEAHILMCRMIASCRPEEWYDSAPEWCPPQGLKANLKSKLGRGVLGFLQKYRRGGQDQVNLCDP